jgi:hypothetical protein
MEQSQHDVLRGSGERRKPPQQIAMENRLYPMRELLADLLMDCDQPSSALTEYEASMRNAPNRLGGYYGAAEAAQATQDNSKAGMYSSRLAQLT